MLDIFHVHAYLHYMCNVCMELRIFFCMMLILHRHYFSIIMYPPSPVKYNLYMYFENVAYIIPDIFIICPPGCHQSYKCYRDLFLIIGKIVMLIPGFCNMYIHVGMSGNCTMNGNIVVFWLPMFGLVYHIMNKLEI